MKVALTTKPTPAQKYEAISSQRQRRPGGGGALAPVALEIAAGGGIHAQAGIRNTTAGVTSAIHCREDAS